MKSAYFLEAFALLAFASSFASAYDPSPLQDFCVAINDTKNGVFVNIKFFVTPAFVEQLLGLNTLGVSLVRIDFAPNGGLNPPQTYPRGTEILVVQEGTLFVGFVSSNQDGNRLFTRVLKKGDVFVFPIGMIHFQLNIGKTSTVAFAALNSQNLGTITIANSVFRSNPPSNPDVLTKAFMLDKNMVEYLQSRF
ncbi:hypothetical protein SLE2022_054280 [Rubroshorea leprosula]